MGISLHELSRVFDEPRLQQRPLRVLDIGSQNLHGAGAEAIVAFIRKHNDIYTAETLENYAKYLSLGADVHPRFGGLKGAWLGDLLERIGVDYLAYDIFDGYRTTIFDLNVQGLAKSEQGAFDLVLNCGTTEHVINQFNSFRVIHDATKVGGLIYHSLPMTGFLDHGYFNYNPRLFWDLACANNYKVCRLTYNGPHGSDSMLEKLVQAYNGRIDVDRASELRNEWETQRIPTASLSVLLEKTREAPFRAALELSTTVGGVSTLIGLSEVDQASLSKLDREEQMMLDNLDQLKGTSAADIISRLATEFAKIAANRSISPVLEKIALQQYIDADPARDDLKMRLRQLSEQQTSTQPLMRVMPPTDDIDSMMILMDGVESTLMAMPPGERRCQHALAAYHRYANEGRGAEFPLALEEIALEEAIRRRPEDFDLRTRLGQVLTGLIPRMRLETMSSKV